MSGIPGDDPAVSLNVQNHFQDCKEVKLMSKDRVGEVRSHECGGGGQSEA